MNREQYIKALNDNDATIIVSYCLEKNPFLSEFKILQALELINKFDIFIKSTSDREILTLSEMFTIACSYYDNKFFIYEMRDQEGTLLKRY